MRLTDYTADLNRRLRTLRWDAAAWLEGRQLLEAVRTTIRLRSHQRNAMERSMGIEPIVPDETYVLRPTGWVKVKG